MTEIKKFDCHYNFDYSIITTNISRFYWRWWGRSKSFTPGLGLATHRHSLPPAQPHPEQLWSVCSSYFGKCFQYIITHRPTTEPEQLMFVILPKIRKKWREKTYSTTNVFVITFHIFNISLYPPPNRTHNNKYLKKHFASPMSLRSLPIFSISHYPLANQTQNNIYLLDHHILKYSKT